MRAILSLFVLVSCGGGEPDPDSVPETESEPACGTASGELAADLSTLSWHGAAPVTDLYSQTWSFRGHSGEYVIRDRRLHEAVRFDLDHPVRVHGFTITWSSVPSTLPDTHELVAGLYRDFGYNGFDFWAEEPLWAGSRCVVDLEEGTATYVLPEPIEIQEPGLIYVAHRQEEAGDPVWGMDISGAEGRDCGQFEACHSGVNLYDTEVGMMYNGWSFPLPIDYAVELHVETTRESGPEDKLFQRIGDLRLGNRNAWGDYNGDGWDDLLTAGPRLFRNDGGTLVEVTDEAGLQGKPGSGGVWGDFDNDGCLDLFLFAESHTRANALMRSTCDGSFEEVTESAGIVDLHDYNPCDGNPDHIRSPASTAAWVDLDADGLLDLYIGNFICWQDYSYYRDVVYHNNGDGTFTEISGELGLGTQRMATRGVSPADVDGDGHLDLLVSHYVLQRNLYFENQGDGTFVERGRDAGLQGNATRFSSTTTYFGHTIGTAWGDLDNDGLLDSVQANLAHPRFFHFSDKTQVLLQIEPGRFEDVTEPWEPDSPSGLRFQETHSVPALADFNNDGDLDLVITATYSGRPTDFYWGKGDGTFELAAYDAGISTTNGWGAAIADLDHDGRPDLATRELWLNTGEAGHSLSVRALGDGVEVNRAGIGATVRVTAGGITRMRHVQGGTGQGGQDSAALHFGLGEASEVERIAVTWPGGATTVIDGPIATDQRVWIWPDGTTHLGWEPPLD